MTEENDDPMYDDELFEYAPEVVESFTEEETEQALDFIKVNDLPMSDLHYALKYVRIANRAVEMDEKFKDIQDRLKNLREGDMAVVSPPKCGELDMNNFNNDSSSPPEI